MIGLLVGMILLAGPGALLAGSILRTWVAARRDATRLAEGEAIFLLAYCMGDDGRPSPRYRYRLRLAHALWERTGLPIWCLGGRLAGRERTNGDESKRYLQGLGVPPEAVRTIDEFPSLGECVETIQEAEAALELARWLGVRRFLVVSDLLQLAQVRLVLVKKVDAILVPSPSLALGGGFELYYFAVRVAALLLTWVDRRGRALGWLRAWRSGRFGGPRLWTWVAWRRISSRLARVPNGSSNPQYVTTVSSGDQRKTS